MDFNDFDSRFKRFDQNFEQTRKLAIGGFLVTGVIALGLLGGLVYVVVHFVGKVW